METGKELTSYFPHDSNARNSDKLIRLRMRHKAAGYGVFFMILERLREEQEYMSIKDYNMIAFDLREDASLIKSVIEDFGLFVFTDDGKYFYSESFKKRMEIKDEKSKKRSDAGKKGLAKRWGWNNEEIANNDKNDSNATEIDSNAIAKVSKNIAIKEKESKIKETSTIVEEKKAEQANKLAAAKAATLKRRDEFYNSMIPYVDRYGKEMIRNFFNYWSELNKSETKMRFETNKTWEISKRLATWARNEKNYDNKHRTNNNTGERDMEEFYRGIASGIARQSYEETKR